MRRGTPLRDLSPGFFDTHNGYRDPPEPPEFWTEEIRRVTDVVGETLVIYRNQDGEELVATAADFDREPDVDGEPW